MAISSFSILSNNAYFLELLYQFILLFFWFGKNKSCRVRMHYGHPDVFDRIFHITRGGISKASRVINISEDIYAGKNDICNPS